MEINNKLTRTTYITKNVYSKIITLLLIMSLSVIANETVLVLRQDGDNFEEVFRGLDDELSFELNVVDIIVSGNTNVNGLSDIIEEHNPKLLVLMDNQVITLYREYLNNFDIENPLPSVSLMGVMVGDAISEIKNATGISYEIPLVTSLVNLRAVLSEPMKRVGVIYREFLHDFVEENRAYCSNEGIELIDVKIPNNESNLRRTLRNRIRDLIEEDKVDALWIPNDNRLLHPDLLRRVWIPAVRRYDIPVVVGVEILVDPQINLGSFAVLPDHIALGTQAAEMVFNIMDNNWVAQGYRVQPPLAVYLIVNYKHLKSKITEEALDGVDRIVK
ncbi:hypothetical protein QA601_16955 [Chitinispirillales bacterium ANBcel5]|uniref:hypothetical protein n=1 Tax=Cellulosispirillum alkaliphilum TaxID=3039283 RepID=UPI002A53BF93|nr:hypothetical protein [Chitinispirillales bacterium ANBcel5]